MPTDVHVESTSWKRPLVIAIASLGLVAGSLWLLTQDLDRLESITTITGEEAAGELEPTPTAIPTPAPTPTPPERVIGDGFDLDRFELCLLYTSPSPRDRG